MVVYTLEQRFVKWACNRLSEDADFGKRKKIIFSDEAYFKLGGYVNKQNYCIWGTASTQNESLFGGDFGAFFFEAIVIDSLSLSLSMLNEFFFTKI